ncbi:MAG TPA: PEP/pyruvate-binding domain-containing protein [Kofleriaceae bacterium]|nr:PEP/pyruvate-binding domain-containing protein [Kofleriaceae bacterium]
MWIRPLAEADASCGAKASGLGRLIAAGLPVPDGFVIAGVDPMEVASLAGEIAPDAIGHALAEAEQRIAHAHVPAELEREVRARAQALDRLAVRSSASIEDGALGSAAGVFASVTDVAAEDVWDAVRTVWRSALTPLAVAYAQRRATQVTIAAVVQRFVPGARMTVYTRSIGASPGAMRHGPGDDDLWLSRDGAIERVRRSAASDHPAAALALAAEAAIGATHGADVELVLETTPGGTRPWVVQARPIVHPVHRRRLPPPPIILAPLVQDGRRWIWDIAHNPDPLSPAQAGLVHAVDRAACSPYVLRVCGGYLYTTPRTPRPPPVPPADAAELAARMAAIEARFVLGEAPTVAAAIEHYIAFTEIWACELSPLVAAARGKLLDRLGHAGHPPEQIPSLAATLIGPRRVLRDPVMSPAWDVAVPTFEERHASATLEFERLVEPLPQPPAELAAEVELARAAADAAERDDLWFARAQWLVRRALLAHGRALGLRGDDIFWLPLDEVVPLRTLDPDEAHRRATAARAAHQRAAEWDMPLVVHGEAPAEPQSTTPRTALRGVGIGPRVVGRVVRFASLGAAAPVGRGDVVVTRAITPALAMFVAGCAALVSETGGLLDHGAALARELGVTCVVGCANSWSQLSEGALVSVNGDAGVVEPI